MAAQSNIAKSHFSDAFFSKSSDGNPWSDTYFRARYNRKTTLPFTVKERDEETSYSYFGARYYDSDLSGLFLSVDPMSDKYPSISPYAYCAWNPVKLIDPMGMDTIVSINIDNGQINMEKNELHNRGCAIQYMNSDNTIIDDYTCKGFVYTYYNKKGAFVIDFGDDSDAEDVYNHLSGRVESQCISSVEWNYYTYNSDNPSQLVTSNKRDEITVTGFGEFNGLLRKMRHYQPYYSDLEYSLPSPEDIRYAREIKAPCHLDYCGKSYRFDNLVPEGYKDPHISIIRHFVKSKNPNYEPYCK